ncbi:phosphotransferase [Paenibacillus thiaminolyticus]|uniref:Phosphotransferase n=1 Tax=Paenibacillus thiaminolyticus TaxID=49283 RepID=A0AAP9DX47_PANTH|nr:phosphotransferase [Paenibacillus thiaminolyticus]MCY9535875.1 phosphotransferase [Paenibacillus thiaminolyticus]MCY9605008.1 phosphotransferase [Paenibacillus thiaminolyticus]MCY9608566.1 phosphotransferase [Paenibacillus thiaminolyticus]MCY9615627.1 phosphotransferase [Paenibacillus thiaminolyticus]MCY9622234.1 phosphotransferase [Paenibacillus thiaminolyticus]
MDSKLGIKIGEGGCSEVFAWEDDSKLVKVAKANTDIEAMRREFHNNQMAWEYGLPVARPYELVEIDGRPGIVYERIYGESIMERFVKQVLEPAQTARTTGIPEGENIRFTARALYEIHQAAIQLPSSQRSTMKYSIQSVDYLTLAEKEAVIGLMDGLPLKQQLCHGDPNPNNILIRNDGKAVVIDWMNASIGNPEADLAEYMIMIRYAVLPSELPSSIAEFLDLMRDAIIDIFMDEYTRLSGITYEDVYPWLVPVAAQKLSADAISEEEKSLLVQEIRRSLKETQGGGKSQC